MDCLQHFDFIYITYLTVQAYIEHIDGLVGSEIIVGSELKANQNQSAEGTEDRIAIRRAQEDKFQRISVWLF